MSVPLVSSTRAGTRGHNPENMAGGDRPVVVSNPHRIRAGLLFFERPEHALYVAEYIVASGSLVLTMPSARLRVNTGIR
jgi:hypothetical protein